MIKTLSLYCLKKKKLTKTLNKLEATWNKQSKLVEQNNFK